MTKQEEQQKKLLVKIFRDKKLNEEFIKGMLDAVAFGIEIYSVDKEGELHQIPVSDYLTCE